MRTANFLLLFMILGLSRTVYAQGITADIRAALKNDDTTKLAAYATKGSVNNCYVEGDWQYSLVSQTVRYTAKKCFDFLISKGADINYKYDGDYEPSKDETPPSYAEKNNQPAVAEYSRSLKK